IDVLDGPIAALALERSRIAKARLRRLGPSDHGPQIGPDEIFAALVEGVAGGAFLGRILAAADIGAGEQRFDRLLGLRRLSRPLARLVRYRDLKTRLGELARGEDRAGGDVDGEQAQAGAENGAEHLVQFEGIHRLKTPENAGE